MEEEKKLVNSRRMDEGQLGCMDWFYFVKDDKILIQFLYNLMSAIIVNVSNSYVRKQFYKSLIIIVYL